MFLPKCRRRARPFICCLNITDGCTGPKEVVKKEVNGGIYFERPFKLILEISSVRVTIVERTACWYR